MSYANMDHAAWVQRQIDAAKTPNYRLTTREAKEAKQGRGWGAAPAALSPFQAKVMDILGIAGRGIYNAPISWRTVDWNYGGGLAVVWDSRSGWSTFDFNSLTTLVFLCHEARIRCEIEPLPRSRMRLVFHQRSHEGGLSERHPSLDEAYVEFRKFVPKDHRIVYRAPDREAEAA